jgi:hypothetical protein
MLVARWVLGPLITVVLVPTLAFGMMRPRGPSKRADCFCTMTMATSFIMVSLMAKDIMTTKNLNLSRGTVILDLYRISHPLFRGLWGGGIWSLG